MFLFSIVTFLFCERVSHFTYIFYFKNDEEFKSFMSFKHSILKNELQTTNIISRVPGCKEDLRLLPSSVFHSAASFFLHFHESFCVTQLVLYARII